MLDFFPYLYNFSCYDSLWATSYYWLRISYLVSLTRIRSNPFSSYLCGCFHGFSHRKRLSCSESLYMEGDSSPPLGARRRFSALMDTHRFASPLEGEPDFLSRQAPIKARGTSLDGANVPSPSLLEQRAGLREINGGGVWRCQRDKCSERSGR